MNKTHADGLKCGIFHVLCSKLSEFLTKMNRSWSSRNLSNVPVLVSARKLVSVRKLVSPRKLVSTSETVA